MTSAMVPAPPTSVPTLNGSHSSIEECAADLLRSSSVFDDLDTEATSQTMLDGWNGEAADAYRNRVRVPAHAAAAASAAVRAAAKAMYDYADEFENLTSRRETLVDWRSRILHEINHLHAEKRRLAYEEGSISHQVLDLNRAITQFEDACDRFQAAIDTNDADLLGVLNGLMTVQAGHRAAAGGDIADTVMNRPGSPMNGGSPKEVAEWWRSLSEEEQFAVIAAYPEIIGATDGLPAVARDQANRLLLQQDIEALNLAEARGDIPAELRDIRGNIRAAEEAMANADGTSGVNSSRTRDPITQEPIPAFLLLYRPGDFGNDGGIAVAIGNPDTADNVAVSVPGINTDGTSIPQYTTQAQNLYESARLSDPNATSATIAWIGYDHPSGWDLGNTPFEGAAKDGGERLSTYVDGLQAARTREPSTMTVFGHSYGSTTAAHAAAGDGLDVDNLVLLGSPGAGGGARHADDLNVPQVWAGTNSRDFVGTLGDKGWVNKGNFFGAGLGRDPAEDDFGAIRFEAEAPDRGSSPNFSDHVKYYERGSESIHNMGQVMVGDYDDVTLAEHKYDPWWRGHVDPEVKRQPRELDPNRAPDVQ